MLTQRQIGIVANDLRDEAERRSYVNHILGDEFAGDPQSWELLIEMIEVVLHRRDLYIVPQERIEGFLDPRRNIRGEIEAAEKAATTGT